MKKLSLLFIIILLVVGFAGESKENIIIPNPIDRTAYEIISCEQCKKGDVHNGCWGDCDKSGIKNGKHCKAYGWAQFHKRTFYWMTGLFKMQNAQWKSKPDQWDVLRKALQENLGHHWTCYKEV